MLLLPRVGELVCRIEIGHASTCVVLLVQPYICQLCVEVICHLRTHQARGQQRIIIYIYNSCLNKLAAKRGELHQ